MTEDEATRMLGFTIEDIRSVYRQGRTTEEQRELRSRIDARLLDLSLDGVSISDVGRALGWFVSRNGSCHAASNALARARLVARPDPEEESRARRIRQTRVARERVDALSHEERHDMARRLNDAWTPEKRSDAGRKTAASRWARSDSYLWALALYRGRLGASIARKEARLVDLRATLDGLLGAA